jgi:hypothetical protein
MGACIAMAGMERTPTTQRTNTIAQASEDPVENSKHIVRQELNIEKNQLDQ